MRILDHLEMYTVDYEPTTEDQVTLGPPSTILCSKGFWVKKISYEIENGSIFH